jgi:hypothetical protein
MLPSDLMLSMVCCRYGNDKLFSGQGCVSPSRRTMASFISMVNVLISRLQVQNFGKLVFLCSSAEPSVQILSN